MFQIGDLVTRKSYDNDIIFRIIAIDDNNYILKGEVVRLYADSPKEDLKIYVDDDKDDFAPEIDNFRNLDRNEYFYLPGKIVHLDQDLSFMNKCMNFYKKNRIKAYGICTDGKDLSNVVTESLNKYNPDIIVITGHDALYRKKRKDNSYKSSDEFAQYEMFQRLNTGGSHLSPQEIRNCILVMKNEEIYKKLLDMSKYENFKNSVPISEKDSEEQGYLELVVKYFVLRYSKFEISDSENYNNFLTDEILKLINDDNIDFEKEEELFKKTFDLLYEVMGENTFKKYDKEKGKSCGAVLVGAYEAVIPGLTNNIEYYLKNKEQLEQAIKELYYTEQYLAATKRGIRPVARIKKMVEFSKENFLSGR